MNKKILVIFLGLIVHSSDAWCDGDKKIKVALLENLQSQKLASEKYQIDYLKGLELAKLALKKNGYSIDIRNFFYGKKDLDILDQIPLVEKWNPDLVIGPRSSNKFLLLRDHFQDTIVLSPMATANAVSKLPSNYYSLSYPNDYAVQALVNFVSKSFPNRNVLSIVETNCKNCVDFFETFKTKFKNQNPGAVISDAFFSNDIVETVDIQSLMKNYKIGDMILLPNTSYASGILVARISDYLKQKEIIFLGSDEWGSWNGGYVGKVKSDYNYVGYRIAPWSLEMPSPELDDFKVAASKYLKGDVSDAATFASYRTLMSAIEALNKQTKGSIGDVKKQIYESYLKELKNDPNWFRLPEQAVLRRDQTKEEYLTKVTVSSSGDKK